MFSDARPRYLQQLLPPNCRQPPFYSRWSIMANCPGLCFNRFTDLLRNPPQLRRTKWLLHSCDTEAVLLRETASFADCRHAIQIFRITNHGSLRSTWDPTVLGSLLAGNSFSPLTHKALGCIPFPHSRSGYQKPLERLAVVNGR